MKRSGSATWNGGLREGKGSVSTESHALGHHPYTFFSRYGEKPGTNPEELLGAAHAARFTMSFVRRLGEADGLSHTPICVFLGGWLDVYRCDSSLITGSESWPSQQSRQHRRPS
jgi:hypothetical protein